MNLFDNKNLKWRRFVGDDSFDYPIDYEAALLNIRDDGHVDLLYRWAPNSYCHFHRHTAETTSVVLDGELHVVNIDPNTGAESAKRVITRIKNRAMCIWSAADRTARWCCFTCKR
jgi:hypothetical protein